MDTDPVFKALADPTRRQLLDMLHAQAGLTLNELCEGLNMRRQSVSQHLDLLEAANLVTSVRDGRRKLHYLNPVPIQEIQNRWIWKFEEPRLLALGAIKQRAEEVAMTTATTTIPDYVYTTYIRATPEQVWQALTDPAITGRFWGHAQVSDWAVGSKVDHVRTDGSGIADASGTVVEFDPPHRLTFGFDDPKLTGDPAFEQSLVTFTIASHRDIVKLTVTQTRLWTLADLEAIGQGWPSVLANLKTLLETGDVLPQAPWEFHAEARAAQMARNG
ncbi:MAG: metalloregulator ArsR/SmtB family transcription factor [Thermomicrobiales bacterium]|nr:metalloregulator ArsR/SmtB family transcription factor [Thermomicrobiales bacterium]